MRPDTEKCLQRYNVNLLGNKKVMEIADAAVGKDETIIYIGPSNVTIIPRNTNRTKLMPGVFVISDKTIYVCKKALWETGLEKFSTCDLERVGYTASGIGASSFELTLKDVTITFSVNYDKSIAADLYNEINGLINSQSNDVVPMEKVSDATEQIRKFKNLLDDGIITQDEFDAKKKELLGL